MICGQCNSSKNSRYSTSTMVSEEDENTMKPNGDPSYFRANFDDETACWGTTMAELYRPGNCALGLGLAGGADFGYGPIVSYLRGGSIAQRCDNLQIGDRLVGVNGIRVTSLRHEDVLTMLRNAGENVQLELQYDLKQIRKLQPSNVVYKVTDITLDKEGSSLGFTVRGGSYGPDQDRGRPLTVTHIRPAGPADREGRICIGDRIIAINGVDVSSATLGKVFGLLREAEGTVVLTVEYDVAAPISSQTKSGPITVDIEKPAGTDLGLGLTVVTQNGRQIIYCDHIRPASAADRCGHIRDKDQLVSVDGVALEFAPLAEVYQLLRGGNQKATRTCVRLELVRSKPTLADGNAGHTTDNHTHYLRKHRSSAKSKGSTKSKSNSSRVHIDATGRAYDQNGEKLYASLKKQESRDKAKHAKKSGSAPPQESISRKMRQRSESVPHQQNGYHSDSATALDTRYHQFRRGSEGSVTASVSSTPCNQVCHSEVMEVVLSCFTRGGYGLIVHRSPGAQGPSAPLFISYIERGSPAEKSGVLQVGDRILAINDWCSSMGTAEEANYRIRHAQGPITLTVEFDVIEAVLPTSGVFTVKLAKRAQSLGIIIANAQSALKGEPVVCADIRTGSVAHRCGSIHPGDVLLTIDNIPLDSCSVDEAVRLLQRSTDIVKLRIQKSAALLNEAESVPQMVVYSVELSRRGGPLGITIAGTEDRYDPIFISQLAPGGLAERTGALHIGDRILAINGDSLADKRVSEAIQLLQRAGDLVALKIQRTVEPLQDTRSSNYKTGPVPPLTYHYQDQVYQETSEKLGTPVQSIDSAVESLEGDSPDLNHPSASSNSNRNSQNSKSSSLSGAHGPDGHHYEDLSRQLQKSLSSLRTSQAESTSSGRGDSEDAYGRINDLNSSCSTTIRGNNVQEDWVRILEALETVGEAEMLRKLEESILQGSLVPFDSLIGNASVPQNLNTQNGEKPRAAILINSPYAVTNTILKRPLGHQRMAATNGHASITANGSVPHSASTSSAGSVYGGSKHEPITGSNSNLSCASSEYVNHPLPPPPVPSRPPCSTFCAPPNVNVPPAGSHELLARYYKDIPYITSPAPPSTRLDGAAGSVTPSSIQLSDSLTPCPTEAPGSHRSSNSPLPYSDAEFPPPPPPPTCLPLEIHRVGLDRDRLYNDFGFSVSDGTDKGVYINKIRVGGPADRSGNVRQLDRILQVNDTNVRDLDCMLAVPLLAACGDRVELLLCRDPASAVGLSKELYTHAEEREDMIVINDVRHTEV